MPQNKLLELILSEKAPANIRIAVARGLAPLPPEESCHALVFLTRDGDGKIASAAKKTLSQMDKAVIASQLRSETCDISILEYFAVMSDSDSVLQTIIENPSTPGSLIESISLTLTPELLAAVLDNRVRILENPGILNNIKLNPLATKDIQRLVQEIETEFLGSKKKEYVIERQQQQEEEPVAAPIPDLEIEFPQEDLSLDGLPLQAQDSDTVVGEKLAGLSFREKIRYALFGNRQIRSLLIRDTNREVSRMVLRSPKITESEIESISSMRGINDEILRDIGTSKEFTKSYNVVHNLIRNPKTPPVVSQRLIFRLRTHDLLRLSRDKGIPEIIRFHTMRLINQRQKKGPKS